jgi:hypothetical protein
MQLAAPFPVTLDERQVMLKPLTVRQRLQFSNILVERARARAVEAGKAAGLTGKELAEMIADAALEAERVSAVVVAAFTFEGAMLVLGMASSKEDAEAIGGALEPGDVGVLAARCLGVDVAARAGNNAGN